MEYREFVETHGILLAAAGLPADLYGKLHHKLVNDVLDGGSVFEIEECENGRQRRLLLAGDGIGKESDVFLVDHAWSFRLPDARKQLETIPGLAERMAKLMCVAGDQDDQENEIDPDESHEDKEEELAKKLGGDEEPLWLELDELGIDDEKLESLDLATACPNLIALSLWGNGLECADVLLNVLSSLRSLRGLWVNENPVASSEVILKDLPDACPSLEIYNSKLLGDFGWWSIGFCCGLIDSENPLGSEGLLENVENIDLSNRGIRKLPTKGFNHVVLPKLTSLNLRGNSFEDVSSGDLLQALKSFPLLKSLEIDIPGALGNSALKLSNDLPKLLEINGVAVVKILEEEKDFVDTRLKQRFPLWSPEEPLSERVLRAMWRYIMTYRLADEVKLDEMPVWYVMDELGSAVRHSDEPNLKFAPFMFLPDGSMNSAVSYTLMWPTKNITKGEECTRDYLLGFDEKKQRSARLTAWFHTPEAYFEQAYKDHHQKIHPSKRPTDIISTSQHSNGNKRHFTVYSDIPQVMDFLNRPEFTLIDDPSKADIIWASWQVDEEACKAFGLNQDQFTNQFPFEACIVMKHNLAETMRLAYGNPEWLPTTYNLESHLAALIGDYNAREKRGDDNLWILKPWNMARTIDTTVTRSLPAIIRHMETGPKICQKYIETPALFRGKKFDLRYVVLLRCLQPLELFLCDVFWIRLALNDYTLDESSLSEYETHFTVMNYRNKLNHVNTHDFVPEFEKEHNVNWRDIHERVRKMLRAVFEAASTIHQEMYSPKSRAIYGVDIMLDSNFHPKLLEVTYCPDCTRACKYDVKKVVGDNTVMKGVDFFNNVFGCLFLNEAQDMTPL
ncbi:hypothetical protein SELMODRAFT_105046 [Selaginella moellendorffii]|uniref:Tubulin--tyrosine ligase-like protein 12 SET-like domain-containing protein n=1 Tax=Selaginella moellendorffii TaxID=88036 RepID=D8RZ55_SELML|nr:tubulin--tyrosine ligase-like protein 12 [Selaginella moellendorffii]EFJ22552.1 hypothetical protein SELMODRAFT_105046 [Selaginella moellendorffii]|eukprot:XP_002976292.1 tubulin--tyrosine ligase-like protein 12 [Selaginella moellendorffii]